MAQQEPAESREYQAYLAQLEHVVFLELLVQVVHAGFLVLVEYQEEQILTGQELLEELIMQAATSASGRRRRHIN